jgi:archaemetzincin
VLLPWVWACAEERARVEPQANALPEPRAVYHRALGDVRELPVELRQYLESGAFEPKREPEPGDWLEQHEEPGQSYGHYVIGGPNRVDATRGVLYLQPLGIFPGNAPPVEQLAAFARDYFQLPVKVLPGRAFGDIEIPGRRRNPYDGQHQLRTGDLLAELRRTLPDDAFCLLGITMVDLYPDDDWNFVFGQASLHDRVGIYSFARHVTDDPVTTVRRGVKILAHETGHMFSMHHCTYFECVMNGSNHLDEADTQPLHLCPVCLLKLHHAVGFDPTARYRALGRRYEALGMDAEAQWIEQRR